MDSKPVILYHYAFSPYAKRIEWYLILRGIPYYQCMQPMMMPRPDVEKLGLKHRRIPIVSIGKDVYLDTRLQLPALEALFPEIPKLGFEAGKESEQYALQHLLSTLTTDSGVFQTAASLIPSDTPLLQDPKWQEDRKNYFPQGDMSKETMDRAKPGAEVEMARIFKLLEGILQDDRAWIVNGTRPSLADIEAIWPVIFTMNIPGALPSDKFSKEIFPKVYAWVDRFQAAVGTAKNHQDKAPKLEGADAAKKIAESEYSSESKDVDATDAVVKQLGLQSGDEVEVWPTDTGSLNRDRGKLLSMDTGEVVFEVKGENGLTRVHAPRHGFRVKKLDATKL